MLPKVHLKADYQLDFEYTLAKDLHMTHRKLLRELGRGELAYWRARYEIDYERYQDARHAAEQKAEADQAARPVMEAMTSGRHNRAIAH